MKNISQKHAQDTLSYQISILDGIVSSKFIGLQVGLSDLSQNTLIGNSLVDDLGRDVYLHNFLHGVLQLEQIPIELFVTDFTGKPFATNQEGITLLLPAERLAALIEKDRPVTFIENCCQDPKLVMVKPIIYANTGMPEGALIAQVSVKTLMSLPEITGLLKSSNLILRTELSFTNSVNSKSVSLQFGQAGASNLVQSVELDKNFQLIDNKLTLRIIGDQAEIQQAATTLNQLVLATGLVTLTLGVLVIWILTLFLTSQIQGLTQSASQIAKQGQHSARLPVRGNQEIKVFASAFNSILDKLQIAYSDLEERSQQQLQRLQLAVDQSNSMILITNTQSQIDYINPAFEKNTGFSFFEVRGKTPDFLFLETHNGEDALLWWQHVAKGQHWQGEILCRRVRKNTFWGMLSVSPILDKHGQLIGFILLLEDITQRKEIEASLKKAKADAEAANHAKSNFLAMMSHELRTPFNGVLGMVQLLQTTPLNPDQQEYCNVMLKSGNSLVSLLTDILDFAKIDAGKFPIRNQVFHLKVELEETISLFSGLAIQKDLALELEMDPALDGFFFGDPFILREIFSNLIGNAVKFTEKGYIRLLVQPLQITPNQTQVQFKVMDTGIGIAQENLETIFYSFEQVDNSSRRIYGGTGLGLAIVKRLVELLDGSISVESVLNQGTVFTVLLTFAGTNQEPTSIQTEEAPAHWNPAGQTLLIVEDDSTSAESLNQYLTKMGYLVDVVHNGESAVQRASKMIYDVILMDLWMPTLNGFQCTEIIRSSTKSKGAKIIAVTASTSQEDRLRSIEAGMDEFLTKPVEFKKLKHTLFQLDQSE